MAAEGRLAGRRVVVVGAGTQPSDEADAPVGNGRATAVAAAAQGATVVCVDRDAAAAEETAARIGTDGGSTEVVVADVATEAGCSDVASAGGSGPVHGVVANVGIARGRRLAGTSADDWDRTFAVNLRSHFLVVRELWPQLQETGASVVFIGSLAGLRPGSGLPAYDASKAGLEGLCRHVALEGAPAGIRANLVAPGLIDTPLGRLATQGRPSRGRTPVPLGRQGTAWEVASVVTFLLSDEASYVTGQTLTVDGGLSLR